MESPKDEKSLFPTRSIIISLIIAFIIFGTGGMVIKNQSSIIINSASFFASCGNYGIAESLMSRIDVNNDPELYKEGLYKVAAAMLDRGDYDSAYDKFSTLGDYSDSQIKAVECIQKKVEFLIECEEYDNAYTLLQDILFFDNSEELYNECQYKRALELVSNGDWQTGARILWYIKDYKDAGSQAEKIIFKHTGSRDVESQLGVNNSLSSEENQEYLLLIEKREQLKDGCLAVGFKHTVGLCDDGRVLSCGSNEQGQCETNDWKNVVQVAAGAYHTVALFENGTVAACGDNTYGQCDVSDWKDVVQIASADYNTVALLKDGSVVTCGFKPFVQLKGWRNIQKLCVGSYSISGIASDGELYSTHSSCRMENKLVDAAMSTAYTIGLTYTGNVVYSSETKSGWSKALSVYAYGENVGIITSDGNASIYSRRNDSFYDLPQGKNALSIALGGTHFAILYEDGSVYSFGKNSDRQCETESWNLIK